MLPVRIRRLDRSLSLPAYETAGAAGFDLAARADVEIAPGRIALVPTGLVIEVPPGHWLGIFARSSTPLKRGLMVANGVGVVDPDYCGPADEVKIALVNFRDAPAHVHAGDPRDLGGSGERPHDVAGRFRFDGMKKTPAGGPAGECDCL